MKHKYHVGDAVIIHYPLFTGGMCQGIVTELGVAPGIKPKPIVRVKYTPTSMESECWWWLENLEPVCH